VGCGLWAVGCGAVGLWAVGWELWAVVVVVDGGRGALLAEATRRTSETQRTKSTPAP